MLPLLMMLTACQTDNGSGSSGNDQTDLSGYATLEDLAALQATIDEQASRIEALEAATGTAYVLACDDTSNAELEVSGRMVVVMADLCSFSESGTQDRWNCSGPVTAYDENYYVDNDTTQMTFSCYAFGALDAFDEVYVRVAPYVEG